MLQETFSDPLPAAAGEYKDEKNGHQGYDDGYPITHEVNESVCGAIADFGAVFPFNDCAAAFVSVGHGLGQSGEGDR